MFDSSMTKIDFDWIDFFKMSWTQNNLDLTTFTKKCGANIQLLIGGNRVIYKLVDFLWADFYEFMFGSPLLLWVYIPIVFNKL